MRKNYSKDEAIQLKKNAFKKLNRMLECFINKTTPSNESDPAYLKKASLISKWIEQYVQYILFEERFDPTKNISYKRGDIVFVNFGFGVGSEFGGKHYAVVLDKNNQHNSSSVTVIPLSSYKPDKSVYPRDVFLGNELYEKMNLKLKTNISNMEYELKTLSKMKELLDNAEPTDDHGKLREEVSRKLEELKRKITDTKQIQKELSNLKQGSVAKIEQIRTISKIRIYNPKDKHDPLYGIRFSTETMKKINEKIKELFVFEE